MGLPSKTKYALVKLVRKVLIDGIVFLVS
jgi:hypothetical protein